MYDRSQFITSDFTGTEKHQINSKAVFQNICDQVTKGSFLIAEWMRQTFGESCYNTIILLVSFLLILCYKLFHSFVFWRSIVVDRNQLPGKCIDCIKISIYHNIKASDLICACTGLHDIDIINKCRFFQKRV